MSKSISLLLITLIFCQLDVHSEDTSYSGDYYQDIQLETILRNYSYSNYVSEYMNQYDYILIYEDILFSYYLNRYPIISDLMAYGSAQYLGFYPYLSKIIDNHSGRVNIYNYNQINSRTKISDILDLSFGINSYNNSIDYIDPLAQFYMKMNMHIDQFNIRWFASSLGDHSSRHTLGLEYLFNNNYFSIDFGFDNYGIQLFYDDIVRCNLYYATMVFGININRTRFLIEGYYAYKFENTYYSYIDVYQYHLKSIVGTRLGTNSIDMIFYYNEQAINIGVIIGDAKRSIQLVLLRKTNYLQIGNVDFLYYIFL